MQTILLTLVGALGSQINSSPIPSSSINPTLNECIVKPKDEVDVPAQAAGVLVKLLVTEGEQVTTEQVLGEIDDTEPQMEKLLAELQKKKAQEEAENDVNIRFSQAAAAVYRASYNRKVEANRRNPNTITDTELEETKLTWKKSQLATEQSKFEQTLAQMTSEEKSAEVRAAQTKIDRRQIKTPVTGKVVAIFKEQGEWVDPGVTILQIVGFSKLYIDGFLNASRYNPSDVSGKSVTVKIKLARGRSVSFNGKISYVSHLVQSGGDYLVRAEVSNRKEQNNWILRPGLIASMTIHIN